MNDLEYIFAELEDIEMADKISRNIALRVLASVTNGSYIYGTDCELVYESLLNQHIIHCI